MMEVKQLITEVAKRHNVILGENDSIFVALTLNELVISDYLTQVKQHLEELEHAAAASSLQAKEINSKLLTDAAEDIAEQMKTVHGELQTKLLEVVDQKIADAHLATEEIRTNKRIALWAAFVSIAAVSFTVGSWVASLTHK